MEGQAKAWSSPSAHDGRRPGPDLSSTQRGNLSREAANWVTPSVAISTGGQTSRSGDRKEELLLTGQAQLVSFLLDQGIFGAGLTSWVDDQTSPLSPDATEQWPTPAASVVDIDTIERNTSAGYQRQAQREAGSPYLARVSGVLNPAFVEWLMGWPIGWTGCACAATALSRWRQRMRSELSQLVSPPAPPAQLNLFGG